MFCGDCGEGLGSPGCCKSVIGQVPSGSTYVVPGITSTVSISNRESSPSLPSPSIRIGYFPQPSNDGDGDPDSDDEEITADMKGQRVDTPNGPGVVIERYEGGGLLAWFVALEEGGERLVEESELFAPSQHLHMTSPPQLIQPQASLPSTATIAFNQSKYNATTAYSNPVNIYSPHNYATQSYFPYAVQPGQRGFEKRPRDSYPAPIKQLKKEAVTAFKNREGVVGSWSSEKGFGFVKMGDGTPDVFVRKSLLYGSELVVGMLSFLIIASL